MRIDNDVKHLMPPAAIFFAVFCMLQNVAYALDDGGAKQVISKFLSSQKSSEGDASPGQHVIGDINGDGKQDIVLLWDILGPTYSMPKMTIFLDQGKTYRALTTDLVGQTQKVSVNGSNIVVETLTLGPKDPRCCPTVKKQLRYQWSGAKLQMLK